jgi:hypothetical protein
MMFFNKCNHHPLTNVLIDVLHSSARYIDALTRCTNATAAQYQLNYQVMNENRQEQRRVADKLKELAEAPEKGSVSKKKAC